MLLTLSKVIPVPMRSRYRADGRTQSCTWVQWRGRVLLARVKAEVLCSTCDDRGHYKGGPCEECTLGLVLRTIYGYDLCDWPHQVLKGLPSR